MIVEFSKTLPEKLRSGLSEARDSFSHIQSNLISSFDKIREQSLSGDELKSRFSSFQKKAVTNIEKTFNDGLQKAYGALNIPTKSEVEEISKRVNKINNDIRRLVDSRSGLKASVKPTAARKTVRSSDRRTHARKSAR